MNLKPLSIDGHVRVTLQARVVFVVFGRTFTNSLDNSRPLPLTLLISLLALYIAKGRPL